MASSKRNDAEWREFEKLVSRIETDAGPAGLVVKSPDRVKCKLTGRRREVDASVRMRVGTSDLLITIECRKRKNRQDVTWIEQLATKRQHIGAAKTIAVSSSDFSAEAKEVARQIGIDLRTLSDVSVEDLNAMLRLDLVLFNHKKCSIAGVGVRFFRGMDWKLPTTADIDLELTPDTDVSRLIFRNTETGSEWSINDLWLQLQETVNPFDGVDRNGKPVIRTVCFPYPGNVDVETLSGRKQLGDVLLSVALSVTVEPVWLDSARKVEYRGEDGQAIQRVEFLSKECTTGNFSISLQLPKNAIDKCEVKTHFVAPGYPIPKSRP